MFFDSMKMKLRRVELGLTQEEAASRAGVSQTHYSFIEQGKRVPRLDDVSCIGTALEMDPLELLVPGENPMRARKVARSARMLRGSPGVAAAV